MKTEENVTLRENGEKTRNVAISAMTIGTGRQAAVIRIQSTGRPVLLTLQTST